MESRVIDELVQKYLEAETSLQEEAKLKEYFSSGKVAPHLQEYVPLFSYFEMSREEHYGGTMNFREKRKSVFSSVAVAASIVIMAGLFFQQPNDINEFGSYEDPELALEKTKQTLQMVSQLMNTGTEDLVYLQEFNNAKNEIIKNN